VKVKFAPFALAAKQIRMSASVVKADVLSSSSLRTLEPGLHEIAAQRFKPAGEGGAKKRDALVALGGIAVECRPPFDKSLIAVDDRRDAERCAMVFDRQRALLGKRVSLRALDIGLPKQALADRASVVKNTAHGADRVTGLAAFNLTCAGAVNPHRIGVEVACDIPYRVGRLHEDSAVVTLRHACASRFDEAKRGGGASFAPPDF
jgi:hypothetical protein